MRLMQAIERIEKGLANDESLLDPEMLDAVQELVEHLPRIKQLLLNPTAEPQLGVTS